MDGDRAPRRRVLIQEFPPCERQFDVHLRDGKPIGLVVDGRCYGVTPRRRSTGWRDGDDFVELLHALRPADEREDRLPAPR